VVHIGHLLRARHQPPTRYRGSATSRTGSDAEGYFADPAASFSPDGSYAVLRSGSVLRRTGEFSFEPLHIEDYEPNGAISDAGAIRFSDDERRLALSISSRNGGKMITLVDLAARIQ
jgi:hypothetical protein